MTTDDLFSFIIAGGILIGVFLFIKKEMKKRKSLVNKLKTALENIKTGTIAYSGKAGEGLSLEDCEYLESKGWKMFNKPELESKWLESHDDWHNSITYGMITGCGPYGWMADNTFYPEE